MHWRIYSHPISENYPAYASTLSAPTRSRLLFGLHPILTLADTLKPSLPLPRTRILLTKRRPRAMIIHTLCSSRVHKQVIQRPAILSPTNVSSIKASISSNASTPHISMRAEVRWNSSWSRVSSWLFRLSGFRVYAHSDSVSVSQPEGAFFDPQLYSIFEYVNVDTLNNGILIDAVIAMGAVR